MRPSHKPPIDRASACWCRHRRHTPLRRLLGWACATSANTDGQNIALEIRYSEGRSDRAAANAAELVALKVDVIVAHFTQATKAAMAASKTIPIVMAPAGAPLQMGFVDSLAH